jgi:hypothetical protein
MELPPYFNFEPIISAAAELCQEYTVEKIKKSLKPQECPGLNHTLLYNKDGEIAWRPFELINPFIYAQCVRLITEEDNWRLVQRRFQSFQGGIVECCSLPVACEQEESSKRSQILNWWKTIEQRSIELSFTYSHLTLTDVSNCYPSIYTHAIAWALHDRDYIKRSKNRFDLGFLGNSIDYLVSASREGQTNGIPQACLLSHILAELILGYCDTIINERMPDELVKRVKILRYRDDYRVFSDSDTNCKTALRVVSECLNDFGLRLGVAKTENSKNTIVGAIKQEKLDALGILRYQKTLQKELLLIHRYNLQRPGSGSIKFLLKEFLHRLERRLYQERSKNENFKVISAILLDIAAVSPGVFPAVASCISKIIAFSDPTAAAELFKLVCARAERIPNNGYMQIWLQRIAKPNQLEFSYTEKMCRQVDADGGILWNFDWICDPKIRETIQRYSIVDVPALSDISPDIQGNEFDVFWKEYG